MIHDIESKVSPIIKTENQFQETMNLAASWYIAMKSKELEQKPQAIKLFGRPLVAWRDKAGKSVIMERFCSHLGASLAIGQVVDGCIQCPFHHWRFDNSGACVHIPKVAKPHIDKIPPTAHQKTYITEEKYGYIWVWYGTKIPLFDIPTFDAAESQNKHKYIPYRFFFTANTSVRRIIENVFDHHHLVTVHDVQISDSVELNLLNDEDVELSKLPVAKEAWFGCKIEAQMKAFLGVRGITKALGLNFKFFSSRVDAWPGGYIIRNMLNGQQKFTTLTGITPISENQTKWQVLIMLNKTGNLWLDILSYFIFSKQGKATSVPDKLIFDTMSENKGQAFIECDRPVLKFRQFYQRWVEKVQQ